VNYRFQENVMEGIAALRKLIPIQRPLAETITRLREEFAIMQQKLRDTQSENSKLKGQIAKLESGYDVLSDVDIAALRRRVAYYCHPDRGGDNELMSKVNTLFDSLGRLICSSASGGSQS
jgi:hypothetical protein